MMFKFGNVKINFKIISSPSHSTRPSSISVLRARSQPMARSPLSMRCGLKLVVVVVIVVVA